jgi:hypothetical protein
VSAELVALGRRIERLTVDPGSIDAPMVRLVRPLLAKLGFMPKVEITKATALLAVVRGAARGEIVSPVATDTGDARAHALAQAIAELGRNVTSVERATVVRRRSLVAHAAWLRRLYEIIVRADRALASPSDAVSTAAAALDPIRLLPPLAVGGVLDSTTDPNHRGASDVAHDPHGDRLMEVELAAIDHLLDAANDEAELLGRRRRLLEAARQMLLESQAAVSLEKTGLEARRRYLAREIARLDRLEAQGLLPDVALTHQVREALSRGERERLHAGILAIEATALARGDERVLRMSREALRRLWKGEDPRAPDAKASSVDRSARQVFGSDISKVVADAYERGLRVYAATAKNASKEEREAAGVAAEYFAGGAAQATLSAALAVDGCFDTGAAMTPLRIVELELRSRAVRHPTPDLLLLPATEVSDLGDAIITDPRSIVLDLAAGRLLARRFVHDERIEHARTVLQTEVRVYVLDGSGSMTGPRARVRDGLLLAELSSLRARLTEHAKLIRTALYFRYFDEKPGPLTRVATVRGATEAMTEVLSTVRLGGTDIQEALLASFQTIREAKASDPDLARAQIVLVTDGDAPVDGNVLTSAREALAELPCGLSVIALGQENDALRAIVARQRARGERAFYHFVSDEMLADIVAGSLDDGDAVHLPEVALDHDSPQALMDDVGELVRDMADLARAKEVEAIEALDSKESAAAEMGLSPRQAFSEGELAKARALYRDRAALVMQFDRFFPDPAAAAEPTEASDDREAVVVTLATIAEMLDVVGGTELGRRADAIDLLERLLPDARLSPARWMAVVRTPTPRVAEALKVLRAGTLTRP